jgi:thioredoxin 1
MSNKTLPIIVAAIVAIGVIGVLINQENNRSSTAASSSKASSESKSLMMSKDSSMSKEKEMMSKDAMSKDAMSKDAMVKEGDAMMKNDGSSSSSSSAEVMIKSDSSTAGTYKQYEKALLSSAKTGKSVLFFHASWCPTCKAAETNINTNLQSIRTNEQLLKVDYDSNTDLRAKYGVTQQHTFVKVDKDGNFISKAVGLSTVEEINNFFAS